MNCRKGHFFLLFVFFTHVLLISVSFANENLKKEIYVDIDPDYNRFVIHVDSKENSTHRLFLLANEQPPTRTICNFDDIDGGHSFSVVWDPYESKSLSRSAILKANNNYQISCTSEPLRHPFKPELNLALTYSHVLLTKKKYTGCPRHGYLACEKMKDQGKFWIMFDKFDQQNEFYITGSIVERKEISKIEFESLDFESPPSGGRSLGFSHISDEAVNELFSVIAEVAVERAKQKGVKLLQTDMRELFCDDLYINKDYIIGSKTDISSPVQIFPDSCAALESVKVDDLAGVGNTFRKTISADLANLLGFLLRNKLDLNEAKDEESKIILNNFIQLLVNYIYEEPDVYEKRLKQFLIKCDFWIRDMDTSTVVGNHCMMKFALATIADCYLSGSCTSEKIMDYINNPKSYFEDYNCDEDNKIMSELDQIITNGILILNPPKESTTQQQFKAVVSLFFDLFKYLHIEKNDESMQKLFASLKGFFIGTVDRDIQLMVSNASQIINLLLEDEQKNNSDLQKAFALMAAMTSYLSTYSGSEDLSPEAVQARHEARKAAINSLIDATTDRTYRFNDAIFSVGSLVGTYNGLKTNGGEAFKDRYFYQPLNVGFGFGIDHFPKTWGKKQDRGFGYHIDFSPLDLGHYLTIEGDVDEDQSTNDDESEDNGPTREIEWQDAIAPSFTIGPAWYFSRADTVLVLGAKGGYSIRFNDSDKDQGDEGMFHWGIVLGIYVPFFDFN